MTVPQLGLDATDLVLHGLLAIDPRPDPEMGNLALESQPLADFLGQGLIAIAISAVLGALFFVGVYALIRRAGWKVHLHRDQAILGMTVLNLIYEFNDRFGTAIEMDADTVGGLVTEIAGHIPSVGESVEV